MRVSFTTRIPRRIGGAGRLGPALLAVFFAASLLTAPLLHPQLCTGACSGATAAALTSPAHEGAPPCHGGAGPGTESRDGGCQCTDDCCSLLAQFVAPPDVADDGPMVLLALSAPPPSPDDARRAPSARLLPYPTGPPAVL